MVCVALCGVLAVVALRTVRLREQDGTVLFTKCCSRGEWGSSGAGVSNR